jgi:hypothetical protein
MKLNRVLDNMFDYNYYIINTKDNNNLINITPDDYNNINQIVFGGEAISDIERILKLFVRRYIFKHEFIHDFLITIFKDYKKQCLKYNVDLRNKMFIVGGTSLLINLEKYYVHNFNEEEFNIYNKLIEKGDIDIHINIVNDDEEEKIKTIVLELLYMYKNKLMYNTMFMYYIVFNIQKYINNNKDFMQKYSIKEINKIKMSDSLKNVIKRNKNKVFTPVDIFVRYNNIHLPDMGNLHLYRLIAPYLCVFNNLEKKSIWAELLDVSIQKRINDNEDDNILYEIQGVIKSIIGIIRENIRINKPTQIEDIPKVNRIYDITLFMSLIIKKKGYITECIYNNIHVNVLTIKGFLYENCLILINTPTDGKTDVRLAKIQFLIYIIDKYDIHKTIDLSSI